MKFKQTIHTILRNPCWTRREQNDASRASSPWGFKEAKSLRIGKYFELALGENRAKGGRIVSCHVR